MTTLSFPARLTKDIAESYSFRQALERVRNGKPATPRSWVYENVEDPSQILKEWEAILVSHASGDLSEIADWDLSKSDKFAAQGEVAPFAERQETLAEYWAHLDAPSIFQTENWKRAIAATVRDFGFNQTGCPKTAAAVIQTGVSEDKYNTSSGDPLCIKRKRPEAQTQALNACENGSWKLYYPILGSRASMGKTGKSARWIFMFPFSVNLKEQTFQQPLQDYIRTKKIPFFTPWEGFEAVQSVLSSIGADELKFGCDYTKMDQHFNFHHALQCFEVIKRYFKTEYWDELYESIYYTFHCPVIAPDYLISGPHAMPSGSGWTNFLETVFNFILVNYIRITYGLKISKKSMGIGDDQIWFIKWTGKFEKLVNLIVAVFKECGLDANPEKQEVSYRMISFLQRRAWDEWSPDGEWYAAVYPTVRALTSEIFPEFYHNDKEWDKKTFALRCLMILENCAKHPCFEEFCIFIAKGNANIVEFALSADAEILLTRQRAKKIANFLPTYNQAKLNENPISFDSLKVIRNHFRKAA